MDAVSLTAFNPLSNEHIIRALISATWISTSSWLANRSYR